MRLVLDAGAFLAVERDDRETVALLKREFIARRVPVTHGGVVGQVWRGGTSRQANVARLLVGIEVSSLDDLLGRRVGVLLGQTKKADAIDAALVLLATEGDTILTSDTSDLRPLAVAADLHVDIVAV